MLTVLRRVFSFSDWYRSHPGEPPPGDMLDASFDAQDNKINEIEGLISTVRRSDGALQNGIVTRDSMHPDIYGDLRFEMRLAAAKELENARSSISEAKTSAALAENAREGAQKAEISARHDANVISTARSAQIAQISALIAESSALLASLKSAEALLANQRTDFDDSSAEAEAWAESSRLWAEHMPDTLPDNALKIMDISGDHWSSRWWANRADNAFGRLTDLYLGAWPNPPLTNLEGGPIEVGSIYYDTDDGQPYVWDGNSWVPFWSPNRSVTSSLWYQAANGQTVFPLSTPDQNGNTFAYDTENPEGTDVHLNGVRLTPSYGASAEADYTIDLGTSTLTLLRPLRLGDILGIDLLLSPEKLAPGAVTIWSLQTTPAAPDGATVAFDLATKASGGPLVNVTRSEELLVSLDGVIQEPGFSYSAIGDTLTFVFPPETGGKLFISWLQAAPGSGGGGSIDWADITGKPATYPPTLPIAQSGVTNLVGDLAAKEATITAGTTAQYWRGDKTWQTLPEGGAATFIGDSPPGSPTAGQLWWESDSGNLLIWYSDVNSSQWVPATIGTPGPPGQWVQLTQAAYDALSPPDPNTLYVVVG
jgi:hypothetical protein